jgi:hypothetical protein
MLVDGNLTGATLDMILTVLNGILNDAHRALLPSAIGLIIAAATIEFYLSFFWVISGGFVDVSKVVGLLAYLIVKSTFMVFAVSKVLEWTDAGLATFQGWSFAVTGSAAMLTQAFNQPSTIWDMGFLLARSLKSSPSSLLFGWDMLAYVITIFSFLGVALHVILALQELRVAGTSATVLVPWGLLSRTAFFCDGVIRWVGACLVRIFVLGIMVAMTIIASARIPALAAALQDLALDSGLTLAGTSFVLAVLTWFLPSIAAGRIAGGGGMGVGHMFTAGLVVVGAASRGVSAVRGVSNLVRR